MTKHSPGSWVSDGGCYIQALYTPSIGMPFYRTIARTDWPLISSEEQSANSLLISAAPELLSTVKTLQRTLQMYQDIYKDSLGFYECQEAEKAIKKAEVFNN